MPTKVNRIDIMVYDPSWYWISGKVRRYIREVCNHQVERFPRSGRLPELDINDIKNIMSEYSNPTMRKVATFQPDAYLTLYRGVFLLEDELVPVLLCANTPVTGRMDKFCLTCEGLMAVFKLADALLSMPKYYLSKSNQRSGTPWLERIRFIAAMSLRTYTNSLTVLRADNSILRGSYLVPGSIAKIYPIGNTVSDEVIRAASLLYSGDVPINAVHLEVTPLGLVEYSPMPIGVTESTM